MTSKEALEILHKNLDCEHCKKFEECCKLKDYETICNYAHYIIFKDLERFEKLNDVWHKHEPMESVDINANHLEDLYVFITSLVEENIELIKKLENIKQY